jgi:MFS family permease
LVGLAWTLPLVALLLLGGAVGDRLERRKVLVAADLVRGLTIGITGLLAVTGLLQLWHLFLLMPLYGAGSAFFYPASIALIPELLPVNDLGAANALSGSLRSLMLQILGPAVGGLVVGIAGPAPAILFDAATFVVSAVAIWSIRRRPRPARTSRSGPREAIEGLRFAKANIWFRAILIAYSVGILATRGPEEVLLPFVIKNVLRAGAPGLGFVLSSGGFGAIAGSVLGVRWAYARHRVPLMCGFWALCFAGMAAYALMGAVWEGALIAFVIDAFQAAAGVIWYSVLQTRVPRQLLGRVTSVDATVSYGLLPFSFALTGPLAAAAGAAAVFIGGGIVGGIAMASPLVLRTIREPEPQPSG